MTICRILIHLMPFSYFISTTISSLCLSLISLTVRVAILIMFCLCHSLVLHEGALSTSATQSLLDRLSHGFLHLAHHLVHLAKRLFEEGIVSERISSEAFKHRAHHIVGHLSMAFKNGIEGRRTTMALDLTISCTKRITAKGVISMVGLATMSRLDGLMLISGQGSLAFIVSC